jgi:hypothetical protein
MHKIQLRATRLSYEPTPNTLNQVVCYTVNSPRKLAINWRLIWFGGMFLLSK